MHAVVYDALYAALIICAYYNHTDLNRTTQVMLYMEERRERIIDFVSNLFGIVGGVITVLR